MPVLDLDMVYAIMVEVGFDTSAINNITLSEIIDTIDQETLVIDAVGIIQFFNDVGFDTTDVPLQAIIELLDYAGFHVINPNAEIESLGLDPETIRAYFSDLGIDDDIIFDYLTDPTLNFDSSIAVNMLEETYNPNEIIGMLDTLSSDFTTIGLGNDDISQKLVKLEKDMRTQVLKREKQTKAPKQSKFKFDLVSDLSESRAGYCSGSFGSDTFFVGLGAREGWENVIVSWADGLCAAGADTYKIDLMIDNVLMETGQSLNCDYEFEGKQLLMREDGSAADPKLYAKSTAKTQFIGIKDDIATALGLVEDTTGYIVLDDVLKSQDSIVSDISTTIGENSADIADEMI